MTYDTDTLMCDITQLNTNSDTLMCDITQLNTNSDTLETERTQRTADILVGESATPVRQDPALGAPSDWQEVVRHIVRSEKEVEARQHNVVLSGVPEEMELDAR